MCTVSIIIVNWHSSALLRDCLQTLARQAVVAPVVSFETIVIDSGSFDGCGQMLATEFPEVHFIQSAVNLGFARSNNAAARSARGRFLLFLNPDTLLSSPVVGLLAERLAAEPRTGALGCLLHNADGSMQTSCVQAFPRLLNQLLAAEGLQRRFPMSPLWGMAALHRDSRDTQRVEAVSGACLMVARSAFEAVGGFSETYFMYGEDIDLCAKLQRAGLVNRVYTPATVTHLGGGSSTSAQSDFSVVMLRESIWRFQRQWYGPAYAEVCRLSIGLAAVARLAALLVFWLVLHAVAPLRRRLRWPAGALRKWWAVLGWSLRLRRAPVPGRARGGDPLQAA
jgi:GT2 family glycosyltransferase